MEIKKHTQSLAVSHLTVCGKPIKWLHAKPNVTSHDNEGVCPTCARAKQRNPQPNYFEILPSLVYHKH